MKKLVGCVIASIIALPSIGLGYEYTSKDYVLTSKIVRFMDDRIEEYGPRQARSYQQQLIDLQQRMYHHDRLVAIIDSLVSHLNVTYALVEGTSTPKVVSNTPAKTYPIVEERVEPETNTTVKTTTVAYQDPPQPAVADIETDHLPYDEVTLQETRLQWMNDERRSRGLHGYTLHPALNQTAQVWSIEMNRKNTADHRRTPQSAYYAYGELVDRFA